MKKIVFSVTCIKHRCEVAGGEHWFVGLGFFLTCKNNVACCGICTETVISKFAIVVNTPLLHHPAYSGLYLGSCSCGFVNFAMWITYFSQSALPLPVFGTSASRGKHRWWPQTAAPLEALTATRRRIKLIPSQKPSAQAQARKPSSWLWMLKMRRLFSPGAKGMYLG